MRAASITGLIGETPLVELPELSPAPGVRLFAKLEGLNPTGSIKDRIVHRILTHAEASGVLAPGQPIVDASTGNTGVAMALYGRLFGHPVHVCVPESVYPEIEELLAAYGATIHRVPRQAGIKSALIAARQVVAETGAFLLDQFGSAQNVVAHYDGTGAEIARDLDRVDLFVAGIGTGGTITGAGRRLKEAFPGCKVLGVEPRLGVHVQGLQSLDDGFVPPVLDEDVLDGKIIVGNRHALNHARRGMLTAGVFGGISSGAVLHAATRASTRIERRPGQSVNVVMIFADSGWKYLGTELWRGSLGDTTNDPDDPLDDVLWW